jgi:hypothetical protein
MSDVWRELKANWDALVLRAEDSAEIGFTAMKGLTWDLVIHQKSPLQVDREIKALAQELDRKEKEYYDRRA